MGILPLILWASQARAQGWERVLGAAYSQQGQAVSVWADQRKLKRDQASWHLDAMVRHIHRANRIELPLSVSRLDGSDFLNAYVAREAGGGPHFFVASVNLVCRFRTDGEFAALIGHELAHMVLKHEYGRNILAKEIEKIPSFWGTLLYGLRFKHKFYYKEHRSMEFEADFLGAIFAVKAGYDPQAFVDFFDANGLSPQLESKDERFETHPKDSLRESRLRERLDWLHQVRPDAQPLNRLDEIRRLVCL